MVVLNLILIGFIIVYCIDYSGFIEEMDGVITKLFKSKFPLHIPKPFSCGTCLTWWTGLVYLIVIGKFTIPYIAVVACISALTPEILSIIYFVKDFVNLLFDTLEKLIGIKR